MAGRQSLMYTASGGPAPARINLAPTQEIELDSVVATFDGASASGAFWPCLAMYSESGVLISRTHPDTQMNAGDSGVVTYGPF